MISEALVSITNEVLSVRSVMASTGVFTKATFNLSKKDCSVSIYTHSECDPVRSVRGAAMSA